MQRRNRSKGPFRAVQQEATVVAEKTVVLNRAHFRKFAQVLEEKASEVLGRVDARANTLGDEKGALIR